MGLGTLTTRVNGNIIDAGDVNDFKSALSGDFVGRNASGVATAGQNLGTATYPWGTGRFTALIINGIPVDVSAAVAPVNRVISGQVRSTSNQPAFIKPNGAANSLIVEATATDLVLDVNGTTVTVTADITKTGLTTAPAANNTALVNDAEAADQEATRTWGEYGSAKPYITIDTAGTEITNLIGKFTAFKINDGSNDEYFFAYVESATKLSKIFRGFFYNSSYAPVNRIKFADNDTITLMKLGWLFLEDDGTTLDVTYNPPTWSFNSPTSPATGDYWYDMSIPQWKRYDGAAFQLVSRTIIGMVVLDSTNAVAARSWDFYGNWKDDNNVDIEVLSNTVLQSNRTYQKISVYGEMLEFQKSLQTWNIAADLATAADMYNATEQASTKYWAYFKDTGDTVLSDISPHFRPDLLGWYHPHNPWRAVGYGFNNGSSNFDNAVSLQVPVYREHAAIVSAIPIPGVSTHTNLTNAIRDTEAGDQILLIDSVTENVTLTGQRKIKGQGRGSVITGNVTFNSSSDYSSLKDLKVTGNITFDSGAVGCIVSDVFVLSSSTITDSNTTPNQNFVQVIIE